MAVSSNGYQCQFLDSVPEDLYCKQCSLVARKLTITSCCGESYCNACILSVQQAKKPCPGCGEDSFETYQQAKYQKKILSLQAYCPHKEKGCGWSGRLEQLDTHVDPDEGECEYASLGHHETAKKDDTHQMTRLQEELERQIEKSLAEKNEEFQNKFKDQEERFQKKFQEELQGLKHELEVEKQELKRQLQMQKEEYERKLQKSEENFQEMLRLLRVDCETKLHAQQETLMMETAKNQKNFEKICCLSHDFRIDNFSEGGRGEWSGPAMFTNVGGYKFRISINNGGNWIASGRSIMTKVCIMKGDYDEQLKWPVTISLNIELVNHFPGSPNKTLVIHCTWKRNERGEATSNSLLIKHAELHYNAATRTHFLKDDTLHFKITNIIVL